MRPGGSCGKLSPKDIDFSITATLCGFEVFAELTEELLLASNKSEPRLLLAFVGISNLLAAEIGLPAGGFFTAAATDEVEDLRLLFLLKASLELLVAFGVFFLKEEDEEVDDFRDVVFTDDTEDLRPPLGKGARPAVLLDLRRLTNFLSVLTETSGANSGSSSSGKRPSAASFEEVRSNKAMKMPLFASPGLTDK